MARFQSLLSIHSLVGCGGCDEWERKTNKKIYFWKEKKKMRMKGGGGASEAKKENIMAQSTKSNNSKIALEKKLYCWNRIKCIIFISCAHSLIYMAIQFISKEKFSYWTWRRIIVFIMMKMKTCPSLSSSLLLPLFDEITSFVLHKVYFFQSCRKILCFNFYY